MIAGTVPYLGIFLKDLTMIDTALEDFTPEGLINFEKRYSKLSPKRDKTDALVNLKR